MLENTNLSKNTLRKDLFQPVDSAQALELLKAGNLRFVEGHPLMATDASIASEISQTRHLLSEKGQLPFAVVLSCSDSRVPPEVVFDVGLGQIFIVRTAGNVADAIAIGSVEYAVEHLGVKLVVVLGHEKCGAVAAAASGANYGPNIGAIVAEIEPSIQKLHTNGEEKGADFNSKCEDENAKHTVAKLSNSDILREHIDNKGLTIVSAKYALKTGEVSFF